MDNDSEYSLEEESYDERIRVMLLGDSNVGKTSILKRYCKNQFSESYISTVQGWFVSCANNTTGILLCH
jgi:GTPase SAR1 family protein